MLDADFYVLLAIKTVCFLAKVSVLVGAYARTGRLAAIFYGVYLLTRTLTSIFLYDEFLSLLSPSNISLYNSAFLLLDTGLFRVVSAITYSETSL